MYDFQQYNSASPQIITSFKGNQKLILGGYRYNIHHVKEGVKTWRCVCAKKLTGARSWCKGRAETWDQDSKGIPKGEHNHQTEHDLAELEYFKSQLIFAAIADPQADLNVLIDDASKFLSDGLNFGNRESMKKSLIVARKSAESGELKLGQQPHRSTLRGGSKKCSVRSKAGGNASASLVPLPSATLRTLPSAKSGTAAVKNQQQLPSSTGPSSAPASTNKSSSSSASSQKQFGTSASSSSSSFLLNSSSGSSGLGSSLGSDFSSESPGYPQNWQQMDISGMASFFEANCEGGAMASGAGSQYGANLGTSNEQLLAAAFFAAAMLGGTQQSQPESATATNSSASQKKSAAIQSNNAAGRSTTSHPSGTSKTHVSTPATHNSNANMKRKRVDGILQKLSSKAVAKISPSPPLPATSQQKEEAMELEKGQPSPAALEGKPKMVSVESQTEESALAEVKLAKKRRRRGSEEEEEGEEKADLDGTGTCQRKVVCCCCADAEELAVEEMPPGCKKRARLLLMATEQQQIKSEPNNNERLKEEEGGREEGERKSSESEEGTAAVGEDLELFELDGEELKLEIADEEEVEEEERENIDD